MLVIIKRHIKNGFLPNIQSPPINKTPTLYKKRGLDSVHGTLG
jgi:hypothetical protein